MFEQYETCSCLPDITYNSNSVLELKDIMPALKEFINRIGEITIDSIYDFCIKNDVSIEIITEAINSDAKFKKQLEMNLERQFR